MSIHPSIECDDEVRPRQQALQCDDYVRSYGLSDHMIDFCVVRVFMAMLVTKKKVSQAYQMSVSKKQVRTKQTTFQLFCLKRKTLLESLLKHISIPTIRSISV